MSAHAAQRSDEAGQGCAALGWYVYAVGAASGPDSIAIPIETAAIMPGAALRLVRGGDLAALVSIVSLAAFQASTGGAQDPAWVAARAAAHHAVVTEVATQGVCLPLGFGTVFSSEAAVRSWLRDQRATAASALARLAGQAEWAVFLHEEAEAHLAWLRATDATLRGLASQMSTAGNGAAFLMGKRLAKAEETARRVHAGVAAADTEAVLRACAGGVLCGTGTALASWTILVRSDIDMRLTLAALDARLQRCGFSLRVTGPWPPYAFARHFWKRNES